MRDDVVSIHAPHEGERHWEDIKRRREQGAFQSTLPTRGSDHGDPPADMLTLYVSIHAPHEGERHRRIYNRADGHHVSIHAPHEGERLLVLTNQVRDKMFQSTLPTRGSDEKYDT